MQLIVDRTSSDVNLETDKGNYNYSDLNRVNTACNELKELMLSVGYGVDSTHKIDWTMTDYPTGTAMANYLTNIYKVINGFMQLQTYTLPSDLQNFTYDSANSIEQALSDISTIITYIKSIYIDAGQVNAGYDGLRGNVN